MTKFEARITLNDADERAWITVPIGRFECFSESRIRARIDQIERAFIGSGVWIDAVSWQLRRPRVHIRVAQVKGVSTMPPWVAS